VPIIDPDQRPAPRALTATEEAGFRLVAKAVDYAHIALGLKFQTDYDGGASEQYLFWTAPIGGSPGIQTFVSLKVTSYDGIEMTCDVRAVETQEPEPATPAITTSLLSADATAGVVMSFLRAAAIA
jgi:hypothetical protein